MRVGVGVGAVRPTSPHADVLRATVHKQRVNRLNQAVQELLEIVQKPQN